MLKQKSRIRVATLCSSSCSVSSPGRAGRLLLIQNLQHHHQDSQCHGPWLPGHSARLWLWKQAKLRQLQEHWEPVKNILELMFIKSYISLWDVVVCMQLPCEDSGFWKCTANDTTYRTIDCEVFSACCFVFTAFFTAQDFTTCCILKDMNGPGPLLSLWV